MTANALAEAAGAFKALGHCTRLRILTMLRSGGLCVCQVTAALGLAASTISGHLAELKEPGSSSNAETAAGSATAWPRRARPGRSSTASGL